MRTRFTCLAASIVISYSAMGEDLRIGVIGLDTSHVVAFTSIINDDSRPDHVAGGKVVAGYRGGSDDIASSYERLDKFTEQLKTEFGVTIYDTIEAMCEQVDAVLLESVDGRPHLEQVKPVIAAGLPVFIDKPMAGSLADVIEIFDLAQENNVPCFSSSSYRYYESMKKLMQTDVGEIRGAISYGPAHIEPTHPDLFWYGVHAVEALFTALGTGCESVVRTHTENTDVVTGVWSGGRVGTLRGLREQATPHQVIVFGTNAVAFQDGSGDYANLVSEIMTFFETKTAPIAPEETIELFAFMEAADESKRLGGVPVSIADTISKARGAAE